MAYRPLLFFVAIVFFYVSRCSKGVTSVVGLFVRHPSAYYIMCFQVRPLVNILLASNTFTQAQLFQILSVSGGIESQEQFNKLLIQLRPLLSAEYRYSSAKISAQC